MQFRIVPAANSPSLFTPLTLGTLWVQPFQRAAPTATEAATPGGVIPVFRNYMGEMQLRNLNWDNQPRDQYAQPGFMFGYNLNIAARCLVPAMLVEYPDASEIDCVSSIETDGRAPFWLAATIHTTNGAETFSLLTAPRDEQLAATSVHEPVLIAPVDARKWFDVSIHPGLLLRTVSNMRNPLNRKVA